MQPSSRWQQKLGNSAIAPRRNFSNSLCCLLTGGNYYVPPHLQWQFRNGWTRVEALEHRANVCSARSAASTFSSIICPVRWSRISAGYIRNYRKSQMAAPRWHIGYHRSRSLSSILTLSWRPSRNTSVGFHRKGYCRRAYRRPRRRGQDLQAFCLRSATRFDARSRSPSWRRYEHTKAGCNLWNLHAATSRRHCDATNSSAKECRNWRTNRRSKASAWLVWWRPLATPRSASERTDFSEMIKGYRTAADLRWNEF